ncbi:MAG: hypothetical protein R3Y55_03845 [Rikenellaceae bacterium]
MEYNSAIVHAQKVKPTGEYQAKFDKACDSVMQAIKQANDEWHHTDVCFNPGGCMGDHFYEEVKKEFTKAGYRFAPTGVWGGVRQTTEQICW